MALASNTHIVLGVSEPKTKAVVGSDTPTVAASDMGILLGTSVNLSNLQAVVGALYLLLRYAKTNLKDLTGTPCTLHLNVEDGYSGVVVNGTAGTAPGATSIVLYIGADVHTGAKSHFLDRTFKRLIELLLQEAK